MLQILNSETLAPNFDSLHFFTSYEVVHFLAVFIRHVISYRKRTNLQQPAMKNRKKVQQHQEKSIPGKDLIDNPSVEDEIVAHVKKAKTWFKDFKSFALSTNSFQVSDFIMRQLAVGVIIAGGLQGILTSLMNDIFLPIM